LFLRSPALGGALAVLALLPAAASARVVQAGTVLPPGNSGFVPPAGTNPDLTNQIDLYTSFRLKPGEFNRAGTAESPRAGVTIVRDAYDVPAVTGTMVENAWFGAGYAAAEDRAVELELFRRGVTGHLAEVLGKSRLDSDIEARRDYYTRPEVRRMYNRMPASLRAWFKAYSDGINAYEARMNANPSLRPKEFALLNLTPATWSPLDSAAISIQLARTIPNSDGQELLNARALRVLGAKRFAKLLPLRTRHSYTTIPASAGRFPSQPGRTRAQERAGFKRSVRFVRGLELPSAKASAADSSRLAGGALPPVFGGSDAWAVRGAGGHAFLFTGPQLGFSIPEQLWEFEIHAPGLDAAGVTPPGVPLVGIGHNDHVAWGLTSGESDVNDLYAEKLVGRTRYRFQGRVRKMDCRTETFKVAGAKAVKRQICRTVHGPVQARAKGVAYARRYNLWGREMRTMVGLADLDRATSINDVAKAAGEVTWNENIMAADDRGNIGWWHPGLLPLRPRGYDERLPYPGTGKAEWRGFLSKRQRPHVVNPKQGWLANWNSVPSTGWTNGDPSATERLTGPLHRSGLLFREVAKAHADPTFASVEGVDQVTGQTAQARPFLQNALSRADAGATGPAKAVLDTLLAWDGNYTRTDAAGTVDPGVAAWDAFRAAAVAVGVRKPYGSIAVSMLGAKPGTSHQFDVSYAQAFALEHLGAAGYRAAAAAAGAALAKRFNSTTPSAWREPRRIYDVSVQGVADKPALPFFDRGTWQQEVELGQ
jgi:acyl-homoserine lactone acylase PvdQ